MLQQAEDQVEEDLKNYLRLPFFVIITTASKAMKYSMDRPWLEVMLALQFNSIDLRTG